MLNRNPIVDNPTFFETASIEKLSDFLEKLSPNSFEQEEAIIIAQKLLLLCRHPVNNNQETDFRKTMIDTLYKKILRMYNLKEQTVIEFEHRELYLFFKYTKLEKFNTLIDTIFSGNKAESAEKTAAASSKTIRNILDNQTQIDEARKTTLTILLDCYNEILKRMQKEEKSSQPVTPKKPFEPSIDISQLNFETAGQVIVDYARDYKKKNNEPFDLPTEIAIVESLREQKADQVFENNCDTAIAWILENRVNTAKAFNDLQKMIDGSQNKPSVSSFSVVNNNAASSPTPSAPFLEQLPKYNGSIYRRG